MVTSREYKQSLLLLLVANIIGTICYFFNIVTFFEIMCLFSISGIIIVLVIVLLILNIYHKHQHIKYEID